MMQPSTINTPKLGAHKFAPVAPVPITDETPISLPEFLPLKGETDMQITEALLTSAGECILKRDHKGAAQLLETALPSLDRFFGADESAKLKALRMLRDCYLALGKGVEAQDCAEVALSIFEDIMTKKLKQHASVVLNPASFARPVVRKLRTLRRSRESEYLKRRSSDISDRWAAFVKSI